METVTMENTAQQDILLKPVENSGYTNIAPIPTSITETGVSTQLLKDLLLKHIYDASVISIHRLSEQLSLSGSVIEELTHLVREEALIELSSAIQGDGTLAFRLTQRGRLHARDAIDKNGYLGPAPVSLEQYKLVSSQFSLAKHQVSQQGVVELFKKFTINRKLLDQVGSAFNSRKAIFIYGTAGTGKTYTIGKMMELFQDSCLIPYAISIKETIIQLFDPQIHTPISNNSSTTTRSLMYQHEHDARYQVCQRPVVIAGGELTADLLEVQIDPQTKVNQAPLQLKANNGIFFIDDIGRQSIDPAVIFNRWIVPMEEGRDYLSLSNGQHFESPFDVQLVFSSNINPYDLADEAILRRIGFKIHFEPIDEDSYRKIWTEETKKIDIFSDDNIISYTLDNLHKKHGTPLLPCHPRDLINIALTRIIYLGEERKLTTKLIDWAWDSYFVRFESGSDSPN